MIRKTEKRASAGNDFGYRSLPISFYMIMEAGNEIVCLI